MSDVLEIRLLTRLIDGAEVTASEADANDNRQAAIGILQTLALIARAVVLIVWMHRAYKNLDPAERRHGTGWAMGSLGESTPEELRTSTTSCRVRVD